MLRTDAWKIVTCLVLAAGCSGGTEETACTSDAQCRNGTHCDTKEGRCVDGPAGTSGGSSGVFNASSSSSGGGSSTDAPSSSGPGVGEERGPCFPNQTCNAGLACLSDICVIPADAGVPSSSSSSPPLPDSVTISLPAVDDTWVNAAGASAVAVAGACSEAGADVTVSGDVASTTVACTASRTWSTTVDLSARNDGTIALSVAHPAQGHDGSDRRRHVPRRGRDVRRHRGRGGGGDARHVLGGGRARRGHR